MGSLAAGFLQRLRLILLANLLVTDQCVFFRQQLSVTVRSPVVAQPFPPTAFSRSASHRSLSQVREQYLDLGLGCDGLMGILHPVILKPVKPIIAHFGARLPHIWRRLRNVINLFNPIVLFFSRILRITDNSADCHLEQIVLAARVVFKTAGELREYTLNCDLTGNQILFNGRFYGNYTAGRKFCTGSGFGSINTVCQRHAHSTLWK